MIDALLDWKLPGGGAVVARARRREEVYAGPCVERAPDVVVELALDAGYGLSLVATPWDCPLTGSVRTLEPHELAGGRGRGMNGTHRPDGILLAVGARRAASSGRPRSRASRTSPPRCSPRSASRWDEALDGSGLGGPPRAYGPEEEALVAERLRRLGYLE